jgi:hypothetical protein
MKRRNTAMSRPLSVSLLGLAAFSAQAQEIKPGLWQYTVQMNMPGVPAGAHKQSFQRCVTPREVQDKSAFMRSDPGSQCAMSDFRQEGAQFSYNVSCKGQPSMTGKVTGTSTPESMNVNMDMTMTPAPAPGMGNMKQTMSARRVGDCKG